DDDRLLPVADAAQRHGRQRLQQRAGVPRQQRRLAAPGRGWWRRRRVPRRHRRRDGADQRHAGSRGDGEPRRLRRIRRRLMRRVACAERADWRAKAAACGFGFHTIDDAPYWDETAYYAFSLREIERDIEAPTEELHAMALDMVGRVVGSERDMERLAIPEGFRDW